MQSGTRVVSKVASAGLAGVLIFLGGFALWSSARSEHAANQLKRSHLLTSAYQKARFAMDDERLFEHQYQIGHRGNYSAAKSEILHRRFDRFASRAQSALNQIKTLGSLADQHLARQLLAVHRRYHDETDQLFRSAQMGSKEMATKHGISADQTYSRLKKLIDQATKRRSAQSISKLDSLAKTERTIYAATLVATPLALLLFAAFASVLRSYRRRSEQLTQSELSRLADEALRDSLTGLKNHRAFQEDLERKLDHAHSFDSPLTLVLLDLDDLKHINDSLGHQAGDDRIKQLADSMRKCGRACDEPYRIGGDEFALILSETSSWSAFRLIWDIQAEVECLTGSKKAVSAGLAEATIGISRNELIRNADHALLEAKSTNRTALTYSGELDVAIDGNFKLRQTLGRRSL